MHECIAVVRTTRQVPPYFDAATELAFRKCRSARNQWIPVLIVKFEACDRADATDAVAVETDNYRVACR